MRRPISRFDVAFIARSNRAPLTQHWRVTAPLYPWTIRLDTRRMSRYGHLARDANRGIFPCSSILFVLLFVDDRRYRNVASAAALPPVYRLREGNGPR